MINNLNEAIAHERALAEKSKKSAEHIREVMSSEIALSNAVEYENCAAEHEQLVAWLEELAERRETDKWISVKDKLPEEYGNYLVLTSENNMDFGTFNTRFGSWSMCDADGFYWAGQRGIRITYWRPMPKAPESEE